jgi:hypothetical protein
MMTPRHLDAVLARSTGASGRGFGRGFGALAAAALALALLGLGACSVDRRSGEYRCTDPAQCPSGMCDQGWCVPGAPMARPDAAPQPGCPAVCSRCGLDTCFIECDGAGACPDLVTCPPGWDCEVECLGDQSCAEGVSCGQATSCEVTCEGTGACAAGVTCGLGLCEVDCRGLGACLSIDCEQSCSCDTQCDDGAPCALSCPDRGATCQRNGQCSSAGCTNC